MNEAVAGLFRTLAPTVASAVLGPLGGVAVAAIGKILGIDSADTTKITQAFSDGKITPDHLAEIKKLELQYQAEEKERGFKYAELEFKREEVAAADRDSARQMQATTLSTTPTMLTYLITAGFFGVLAWMLADSTVVNSPPILIMLGSLGTAFAGAVNFWFGTTSGSREKDKLLMAAQPAK